MEKRVFSGIQPSGNLHLGNYIGALRQWKEGQNDGLNIFCVVDMHAITVPQDPQVLRNKTLETAAMILAAGIDPEKSILFVQSHNPDHANLGWIMNCMSSMGQMSRMTQYKEKSEGKEFVSVGLFDYPALMASDILLYDTTEVPIGDDQKQHVELSRDLAERFNSRFGDTFVLPKPVTPKLGARIMSLNDPTKKMSKSDPNPNATIYLLDEPEVIRKKISSAVTDGERRVKYDFQKQPGISNLLEIYSSLSGREISEIEADFETHKTTKGYNHLKDEVSNEVIKFISEFQKEYKNFREDQKLNDILEKGAVKAIEISHKKLQEVYEKVGFIK